MKDNEIKCKDPNRIKTYEDACAELGVEPINEEKFRQLGFREYEIAERKLEVISKSLCSEIDISWMDSNIEKWWPWFSEYSGNFVFDCSHYVYNCSIASRSAMIFYPTETIANYAGRQFIDLYKIYLT